MAEDEEERIRRRAHAIWEEEGRPEGRQEEHWRRARRELASGSGPREEAAAEDAEAAPGKSLGEIARGEHQGP